MTHAQNLPGFLLQDGARRDLLLVCDHAGNRIPPEFDQLGLETAELGRHIAWDPGALGVARGLARQFDAPLYGCLESRLLADPNRSPGHPDLILVQSDGVFVPGNELLDAASRAERVARFHQPYHAALAAAVAERLARGIRPFLLSIHSFEPVWAGVPRPWPVGVLWKTQQPIAERVAQALERQVGPVGRNQPYDGRVALGHTLETHAIAHGLPHLLIELRNDGITDQAGQQRWTDLLASALMASLPDCFRPD